MIKKFFLHGALSALVTLTAAFPSAMAATPALVIANNTDIPQIKVQCGNRSGVPIGKTSFTAPTWMLVKTILGALSGSCSFYNGSNRLLASASLQISTNLHKATITSIDLIDPNLKVAITPGVGIEAPSINVIVSGY